MDYQVPSPVCCMTLTGVIRIATASSDPSKEVAPLTKTRRMPVETPAIAILDSNFLMYC